MPQYNKVDIAVSASGDLVLDSNTDFLTYRGKNVLKQDIAFRLRTDPGGFVPHADLGAGLSDLIGEPNTRENAKIGESKIRTSLISDGMVGNTDLYVRGVPVSQEAVMYYVFVNNGENQLNVTPEVIFEMNNGLTNIPGV
jgi:hypothetical protein